jgi:hypothetical protein
MWTLVIVFVAGFVGGFAARELVSRRRRQAPRSGTVVHVPMGPAGDQRLPPSIHAPLPGP